MGEVDTERQALNVARMRLLGAEVVPVKTGSRTLKDAINDAYRDWVASVETTNYIFGTAAGPHPFPAMVRDFQKVISEEARAQLLDEAGRLPDAVIACVGGGSNAIGMFDAFLDDEGVKLYGVEAAGDGVDTPRHAHPSNAAARRAARRQDVRAAGRGRPDDRVAFDLGRDSTTRASVPSTRGCLDRARRVHPGDRRRGDAGAAAAVRDRGHHPGDRVGARPRRRSAHRARARPDAILAVCLSGRGDKDMDTAARYFDLYDGADAEPRDAARRRRGQGRGVKL